MLGEGDHSPDPFKMGDVGGGGGTLMQPPLL